MFINRVPDYRSRLEALLEAGLPSAEAEPVELHGAMRHAVLDGGKRMRPLLVYATGEALNIEADELDPAAMAVELVHCYSLVHDDLPAMDDDDLRRGRPTVHRAFDEATAILAGDALHALAFQVLAGEGETAEACALLARAAGVTGMCGGQALDLRFERADPARELLETMYRQKTGALIEVAVDLAAARRLPAGDPVRQALGTFAGAIGLAFQIRDDLLEVDGESEVIGKSTGSDAARGKATWPSLFGINAARRRAAELIDQARAALDRVPGDTEGLAWLGERMVNRDR